MSDPTLHTTQLSDNEIKAQIDRLPMHPERIFQAMTLRDRCECWCDLNAYSWPTNPQFPWPRPPGYAAAHSEDKLKLMGSVWDIVNANIPIHEALAHWHTRYMVSKRDPMHFRI